MEKEMIQMMGKMMEQMNEVQTDVKEMKTEMNGMKTEISGMKIEISDMKTEISDMKTEISGIKTEISGMKTEMNSMKIDMNEMNLDMTNGFDKVEKEIADLKNEVRTGFYGVGKHFEILAKNIIEVERESKSDVNHLRHKIFQMDKDIYMLTPKQ